MASGDLVYKSFDKLAGKEWTTGVWAEPETIDAAYWEFHKDTANYVAAAEKLVTPYVLFRPMRSYGNILTHFVEDTNSGCTTCWFFLRPSLTVAWSEDLQSDSETRGLSHDSDRKTLVSPS